MIQYFEKQIEQLHRQDTSDLINTIIKHGGTREHAEQFFSNTIKNKILYFIVDNLEVCEILAVPVSNVDSLIGSYEYIGTKPDLLPRFKLCNAVV
jgi:hypothetical protein